VISFANEKYKLEHRKMRGAQNVTGNLFRGHSFFIERGEILDDYLHPNQKSYPEQRIMVISVADYVYLIPYVENEEELFLKTIIPSRKATQQYLGEKHED
jgi:hypothetical protein